MKKSTNTITMALFLVILFVQPSVASVSNTGFGCRLTERNTIVITHYKGPEKDIVIPAEMNGYRVTDISDEAFDRTDIKSVIISEGIQVIGDKAFYRCDSLEKVALPSSLTRVGNDAFLTDGPTICLTVVEGSFADKNYSRFPIYTSSVIRIPKTSQTGENTVVETVTSTGEKTGNRVDPVLPGFWTGRLADQGTFLEYSIDLRQDGTGTFNCAMGEVSSGRSIPMPEMEIFYTYDTNTVSFFDKDRLPISLLPFAWNTKETIFSPKYIIKGNELSISVDKTHTLVLERTATTTGQALASTITDPAIVEEIGSSSADSISTNNKEIAGEWYKNVYSLYDGYEEGFREETLTAYDSSDWGYLTINGDEDLDMYLELDILLKRIGIEDSDVFSNGARFSSPHGTRELWYEIVDGKLATFHYGWDVYTRENNPPPRIGYAPVPGSDYVNAPNGLNLRKEPSSGSTRLKELAYREEVCVLETEGAWTKVLCWKDLDKAPKSEVLVGYVASEYLHSVQVMNENADSAKGLLGSWEGILKLKDKQTRVSLRLDAEWSGSLQVVLDDASRGLCTTLFNGPIAFQAANSTLRLYDGDSNHIKHDTWVPWSDNARDEWLYPYSLSKEGILSLSLTDSNVIAMNPVSGKASTSQEASQTELEKPPVIPGAGKKFMLDVPYLNQEYYKNWDHNCGQTCTMMLEQYLYPNPVFDKYKRLEEINTEFGFTDNNLLHGKSTTIKSLKNILEWMGFQTVITHENGAKTLGELKEYLDQGMPVIVHVFGRYSPNNLEEYPDKYIPRNTSGGHMIILIGYDDDSGEIIFHDSGTGSGKAGRYSYEIFDTIWSASETYYRHFAVVTEPSAQDKTPAQNEAPISSTVGTNITGLPADRPVRRNTTSFEKNSIRYISQSKYNKSDYDASIWDNYNSTSGCYVSAISMAISSLGFDLLPKQIISNDGGSPMWIDNYNNAVMIDDKNVFELIKESCTLLNVQDKIKAALERFRADPNQYSPPLIQVDMIFTEKDENDVKHNVSKNHMVVVLGIDDKSGYYHILDSSFYNNTLGQVVKELDLTKNRQSGGAAQMVLKPLSIFQYKYPHK